MKPLTQKLHSALQAYPLKRLIMLNKVFVGVVGMKKLASVLVLLIASALHQSKATDLCRVCGREECCCQHGQIIQPQVASQPPSFVTLLASEQLMEFLPYIPVQDLELSFSLLPENIQQQFLAIVYSQLLRLYQRLMQLPEDQQQIIIETARQLFEQYKAN